MNALTAAAIAIIALATIGTAPALAQDAPELEVDDRSELSADGVLHATASGLEPGMQVFVLLCNTDESIGDAAARCALIGAGSEGYEVADDGTVELEGIPLRAGRVGTSAQCPPTFEQDERGVVCEVVLADADQQQLATGAIAYEVPDPVALPTTGPGPATSLLAVIGGALVVAGLSTGHARRRPLR